MRKRAINRRPTQVVLCKACGALFKQRVSAQVFCSLACQHQLRSAAARESSTLFSRLIECSLIGDGCWEWDGLKTPAGYGRMYADGGMSLAHRISWVVNVGPIPSGLYVLHKCDNPPCIRPDHLFLGSIGDNNRDRANKRRGQVGICHHAAKLTEEKVRAIFADSRPYSQIVAEYGISKSRITEIKRGGSWAHLELVPS